jgi:hypothetical protein
VVHPVEQIVERSKWLFSTPLEQLPLHVGGVVRAVRRCGTFVPPSLLGSCPNCPPSPCGRLSRPRTTTGALPLAVTIARHRGHPEGSDSSVRRFRWSSLDRSRTQLYPVRNLARRPCEHGGALRGSSAPRPSAKYRGPALRDSLTRVSPPTSELVKIHMSRGFHRRFMLLSIAVSFARRVTASEVAAALAFHGFCLCMDAWRYPSVLTRDFSSRVASREGRRPLTARDHHQLASYS